MTDGTGSLMRATGIVSAIGASAIQRPTVAGTPTGPVPRQDALMMTIGFPRMRVEPGERRDFLPPIVARLAEAGAEVIVERGIGSAMGLGDRDYTSCSRRIRAADDRSAYDADVVVILRAPEGRYQLLHRGAVLVSMLHFPTRPARVKMLEELGIDAVSLDTITDGQGRRLVENLSSVAWNGLDAAFGALESQWPQFTERDRRPVRVTIMGAGTIGKHAVEAATKVGSLRRCAEFVERRLSGVEVVVIGRMLTTNHAYMHERIPLTDILVDAAQRSDPSLPIIPNAWIAELPSHAVICDLVVDPYLLDVEPRVVRGIEGIPQGNLDRYVLTAGDPAWDRVPPAIPTAERRTVASCYSWPGVKAIPCMEVYGSQLAPMLEALVRAGGLDGIRADGHADERALWRGSLRAFRSDEHAAREARSVG
jgi:alanine dehydrogenase